VDAAAIAKAKVELSEQERRQAEVNAQRLYAGAPLPFLNLTPAQAAKAGR
jgi:hypothetical protein